MSAIEMMLLAVVFALLFGVHRLKTQNKKLRRQLRLISGIGNRETGDWQVSAKAPETKPDERLQRFAKAFMEGDRALLGYFLRQVAATCDDPDLVKKAEDWNRHENIRITSSVLRGELVNKQTRRLLRYLDNLCQEAGMAIEKVIPAVELETIRKAADMDRLIRKKERASGQPLFA